MSERAVALRLSACFLFATLGAFPFVAAITNQQHVHALIALHKAWSSNPAWDTSTDPCDDQWLGVTCDSTNSSVVGLTLLNQHLQGILPAVIGKLNNLTALDLSSNPYLGGSLPKEIGTLSNVVEFYVQFCSFSGEIPSEISGMTNLLFLGLTSNSFTGPLPASIGLLKKMIWLDLSNNFLNGSLPDSTSSAIGSGLDNLTNARHFHLHNNSFSGNIPSSIFNSQMQLLHVLLYNNSFIGSIPSTIGDLRHTEIVRLDFNGLKGPIPSTISKIQNLTTLQLNNNALTGKLPDLSKNTKLRILELGNNQFEAFSIPEWITMLPNLQLLSLPLANLTGNVPSELFALQSISNVTLGSNDLNGTLNLTIASPTLLLVNVTNNSISSLYRGNYAQELILNGNPYCDNNQADCATVQSTSAPAPSPAVSACTNTCHDEYAINPRVPWNCECALPVVGKYIFEATITPLLTDFNISQLEEEVFESLLDHKTVGKLMKFESQVVVYTLSSILMSVSVFPPNGTDVWSPNDAALLVYAFKDRNAFTEIGPWNCLFSSKPYIQQADTGFRLSKAATIAIGVVVTAFAVVFVMMGAYAVKQKRRAKKAEKLNKPFGAWIAASEGNNPDIPQLKGARWFNLTEIRKCTNNFSQFNEIGQGGYGKVYKGHLLSGEQVAIKRAGSNSLQGATEFKKEIEYLSRVHHRNLVGLIGFCFEEGEQMLVYEYMSNGTLREWLLGQSGFRLDWKRRIDIALGSARGIAYLHTEAYPSIIHRDIKSSNILLDDKLVPKVSDFGLSVGATNCDNSCFLMSEIMGTPGYVDPDYFMSSRLTDKSDVYSFGVILIELITGRMPIQQGRYVIREVKMGFEQGGIAPVLQSFVDPHLTDYPPRAMEKLLELSLRCLDDDPDPRPRMGDVVRELEPLAQEFSIVPDKNQGMAERFLELSPCMKQDDCSTSFDYSGSYDIRMSGR